MSCRHIFATAETVLSGSIAELFEAAMLPTDISAPTLDASASATASTLDASA